MNRSNPKRPRLAILGGGLAGIAAAELVSRAAPSFDITLFESRRRLGGRAGSYVDPNSQQEIDYCQHVAMGCCTNFVDLMRQCKLSNFFNRLDRLTFLHPDAEPSLFAPNRFLPAPFHLLGTIGAMQFLTPNQKREIRHALGRLLRDRSLQPSSTSGTSPGPTAKEWLQDMGQSPDTIREFWDVILVSALGEHTDRVAMSAARKVLVDGFAIAHGASDVWVPTLPLSKLIGEMAADAIAERGVTLRTGTNVRQIQPNGCIETASENQTFDYIICAVPWHRVEILFSQWDDDAREKLPDLGTISDFPASPISGVHLWFDRPITTMDHAVIVGLTSQWLFRPPAQSDATSRGEHYHQVVVSAAAEDAIDSKQKLIETVVGDLRRVFPDAAAATLLRYQVVTDPKSVFSIRPEVDSARPGPSTGLEHLFLAGDWTQTGWPATMEGAVISGRQAACGVIEAAQRRFEVQPNQGEAVVLPGMSPGWLARMIVRRA